MVNRNLLRQFDVPDDDATLETVFQEEIHKWIDSEEQDYEANKIVTGKVIEIRGDDVVIDIGYKSEGIIKIDEWKEDGNEGPPPKPGDTVEVLLETVESEDGTIQLSYRKAKRQKEWNAILAKHKEGDVVAGKVLKKIKGGLLVNIGVNVFLPASQVDIRRPQSIDEYIDRTIECVILKIDEQRRNIVVSRRKLIEDRRRLQKDKLLAEPVAEHRDQVPGQQPAPGRSGEHHALWGLRETGTRHRGARPHLRDVVGQAHRRSQGARPDRRQGRSPGPQHQPREEGNLAGH